MDVRRRPVLELSVERGTARYLWPEPSESLSVRRMQSEQFLRDFQPCAEWDTRHFAEYCLGMALDTGATGEALNALIEILGPQPAAERLLKAHRSEPREEGALLRGRKK